MGAIARLCLGAVALLALPASAATVTVTHLGKIAWQDGFYGQGYEFLVDDRLTNFVGISYRIDFTYDLAAMARTSHWQDTGEGLLDSLEGYGGLTKVTMTLDSAMLLRPTLTFPVYNYAYASTGRWTDGTSYQYADTFMTTGFDLKMIVNSNEPLFSSVDLTKPMDVAINADEDDVFEYWATDPSTIHTHFLLQDERIMSSYTPDPSPSSGVPEPAQWTVMVVGFGLVGALSRRRRRRTLRQG